MKKIIRHIINSLEDEMKKKNESEEFKKGYIVALLDLYIELNKIKYE